MENILSGKVAQLAYKEQLIEGFKSLDFKACLAIIHFNDPSSMSYLNGRLKLASELNVDVKVIDASNYNDTNELVNLVKSLNEDKSVNGIMVDRPLPKKFDEAAVLNTISVNKDVDGYTQNNLGRLVSNLPCFNCATPLAAIRLLEYYNYDFTSKKALVIGRSINVGKPLALMLLNKNCTVTVAHSKTLNLKESVKDYDIVFLALGKAGFLTSEFVNENQVVVDIGINYVDGHIVGDLDRQAYDKLASYSPVPGGVGVLTNIVLFENLLKACKQ